MYLSPYLYSFAKITFTTIRQALGSQPIRAICVKEEAMAAMASCAQGTLDFNVASRPCVDVIFKIPNMKDNWIKEDNSRRVPLML